MSLQALSRKRASSMFIGAQVGVLQRSRVRPTSQSALHGHSSLEAGISRIGTPSSQIDITTIASLLHLARRPKLTHTEFYTNECPRGAVGDFHSNQLLRPQSTVCRLTRGLCKASPFQTSRKLKCSIACIQSALVQAPTATCKCVNCSQRGYQWRGPPACNLAANLETQKDEDSLNVFRKAESREQQLRWPDISMQKPLPTQFGQRQDLPPYVVQK